MIDVIPMFKEYADSVVDDVMNTYGNQINKGCEPIVWCIVCDEVDNNSSLPRNDAILRNVKEYIMAKLGFPA